MVDLVVPDGRLTVVTVWSAPGKVELPQRLSDFSTTPSNRSC